MCAVWCVQALSQFYEVVSAEKARGDEINYRFKALQNIVILCCRLGDLPWHAPPRHTRHTSPSIWSHSLTPPGRLDEMAQQYQELLALMDKVTRNDASDAINTILDSVSGSGASASGGAAGSGDLSKLERVYALTLTRLKQNTSNQVSWAGLGEPSQPTDEMNDTQGMGGYVAWRVCLCVQRLWFNTSVKLAKLYLDTQEFGKLQTLIRDLHKSCTTPDGADDTSKGSALLEVRYTHYTPTLSKHLDVCVRVCVVRVCRVDLCVGDSAVHCDQEFAAHEGDLPQDHQPHLGHR